MAKELFEVNFFGTLRLTQAVLPSMKARKSGCIINNGSHFGIVGTPFSDLYAASKFAVEGLTESLAPALVHFNIRCSVNSLSQENFFSQKNPNIACVAEEIFPRLVTSAKQQRYPCSGLPSDSTNDRKCFSTFNQIYKSTMAFSIGQYGAYSNPGTRTGGAKTKDFVAVSQADVTTEV